MQNLPFAKIIQKAAQRPPESHHVLKLIDCLLLSIPISPSRPEPSSQMTAGLGTASLRISARQFRLALHESFVVGDVTACRITCSTRVS